jgi:hypothetical protein
MVNDITTKDGDNTLNNNSMLLPVPQLKQDEASTHAPVRGKGPDLRQDEQQA